MPENTDERQHRSDEEDKKHIPTKGTKEASKKIKQVFINSNDINDAECLPDELSCCPKYELDDPLPAIWYATDKRIASTKLNVKYKLYYHHMQFFLWSERKAGFVQWREEIGSRQIASLLDDGLSIDNIVVRTLPGKVEGKNQVAVRGRANKFRVGIGDSVCLIPPISIDTRVNPYDDTHRIGPIYKIDGPEVVVLLRDPVTDSFNGGLLQKTFDDLTYRVLSICIQNLCAERVVIDEKKQVKESVKNKQKGQRNNKVKLDSSSEDDEEGIPDSHWTRELKSEKSVSNYNRIFDCIVELWESQIHHFATCSDMGMLRNRLAFRNVTPENLGSSGIELNSNEQAKLRKAVDQLPLNVSQKSAIMQVASRDGMHLFTGPPGTGKTLTIVNMIKILREFTKTPILVIAYTNQAIDVLLERLADPANNLRCIKIGAAFRTNAEVQEYTISNQIESVNAADTVLQDLKAKKLPATLKESNRMPKIPLRGRNAANAEESKAKPTRMRQNKAFEKGKRMNEGEAAEDNIDYNKLIRNRERSNECKLLKAADVILSTPVTIMKLLKKVRFHTCFLDEAGQITEAASIVPCLFGISRLIMFGDSKQLTPYIESDFNMNNYRNISMFMRFELVMDVPLLKTQYRMHPEIARIINSVYYDDRLENGIAASDRKPRVKGLQPTRWVQSYDLEKRLENSYFNPGESADISFMILRWLEKQSVLDTLTLGVITFYKQQQKQIIKDLTLKLDEYIIHNHPCAKDSLVVGYSNKEIHIMVKCVDAYQGQEADIIMLSCVRAHLDGYPQHPNLGFTTNSNRLNISMSRAKYHLIIFGDKTSFVLSPEWERIIQIMDRQKTFRHKKRKCIDLTGD